MRNQTPTVGSLIHEIDRLVKKRFDRFAETTGMSRAQWYVLAHVSKREGINQATLADLVGVEPITICRMVDRLEALGLVERRPDPNDRRARLIHMIEAARPGLERMRAVAQALFAEALDGFTGEEEAILARLLGRIHANLLVTVGETPSVPSSSTADNTDVARATPDQKA
jgi:MarR family transcriptional regulator, transcriptional regulator for hemolysin